MARIAHLALGTPDVVKTTNFYKEVFGLHEVMRSYEPEAGDNPRVARWYGPEAGDKPPVAMLRNLYLSDGHMNLTICNAGGGGATRPVVGMYHFGFLVDSVDETLARAGTGLTQLSPRQPRSSRGHIFEVKTRGPEGVSIDLAETGRSSWPVHPTGEGAAKIQHIALGTPDVVKTANFYKEVFGLYEVARKSEPGAGDDPADERLRRLYLFDGNVNLTICKVLTVGMYHFGFLVDADNMNETRKRMEAAGCSVISSPRSGPGHHLEFKYKGPEGVVIDLSSTGWGH